MNCVAAQCERKALARGLCVVHYERAKRDGALKTYPPMKHGRVKAWIEEHENWSDKNKCLTWPFGTTKGYGVAEIGGVRWYVHRYYCKFLNGPPPSKEHLALHDCGRGAYGCVNPHHTYWGTQKQNLADRIRHDTVNSGPRNGRAVLNQQDVVKVHILLSDGKTISQVAKKMGVNYSIIYPIAKGKTYKDKRGVR